jgi:flagellar hook-associated protein 3 FlgL
MRVTNGMISRGYLNNLNSNLSSLAKYQNQMATGRRIATISDDPAGVLKSMQTRVKLYKVEQYKSNIENAQTWLQESETNVMELNEVIQSAYEATIQAANTHITDTEKKAIAEMVQQLRDHVLEIANSKVGDKFLFGGYNTTEKPFKVDPVTGELLYNGISVTGGDPVALALEDKQYIQYETGYQMKTDVSIPGTKLVGLGENNIYVILDELTKALESDASSQEISAFAGKLQNAQGNTMALAAEIGGRTNRLKLVKNRYEDEVIRYKEMKSEVEDIDQAEVIMQFKMAESVYLAALRVGTSIVQPSLVDYLKL